MYMPTAVTYTHYDTSSRGGTGNIIMSAKFEEGDILTETCDDMDSGDESYDDSNMPPLISKEEIDVMDAGDESDDENMSIETLGDIRDGRKSNPSINRREAH